VGPESSFSFSENTLTMAAVPNGSDDLTAHHARCSSVHAVLKQRAVLVVCTAIAGLPSLSHPGYIRCLGFEISRHMSKQLALVLYVAVMAAVIVGVDVAFFRDRFWERLMSNVGIVLIFGAFYLRFFGQNWGM
jgi:hypothetical protein